MAKRKRGRYGVQRVDVNWYGDEFLSTIDKYGDEGLFAAGEVVLAEAQRRAPFKRGFLRLSGYIATRSRTTYVRRAYWRKKVYPPVGAVTIAFSAPHAHLIEGGRRRRGQIKPRKRRALSINGQMRSRARYGRMSARPFLGPAIEATKDTMVVAMAGVLRKRLEQNMPEGR